MATCVLGEVTQIRSHTWWVSMRENQSQGHGEMNSSTQGQGWLGQSPSPPSEGYLVLTLLQLGHNS
jgi:hypothetical protein